MAVASIERVGSRVVWLIGARDDDFEFAVSDDRFKLQEIAQAIVETEAELVQDFADSYHAQREQFVNWVDVENESVIPDHLGPIEGVKVQADEDEAWVLAEQTKSYNIGQWRKENNVFDDLEHTNADSSLFGYFSLTNNIIEFTGESCQVGLVQYTPDYPTSAADLGSLQVESKWEGHLVNGAIKKLAKIGVEPALVSLHGGAYDNERTRILSAK